MNLSYFFVLMQSNFLECLIFTLLYLKVYRASNSWVRCFAVTSLANCITHPVVFFGFMASGLTYFWAVLWAEGFAIASETILHKGVLNQTLTLRNAIFASFLANLVSWQLGPMLTYFALRQFF